MCGVMFKDIGLKIKEGRVMCICMWEKIRILLILEEIFSIGGVKLIKKIINYYFKINLIVVGNNKFVK